MYVCKSARRLISPFRSIESTLPYRRNNILDCICMYVCMYIIHKSVYCVWFTFVIAMRTAAWYRHTVRIICKKQNLLLIYNIYIHRIIFTSTSTMIQAGHKHGRFRRTIRMYICR